MRMGNVLSALPSLRVWFHRCTVAPRVALAIALLVTGAADVELLTAQSTTEMAGQSVEIGLGAGVGTGRFGGPGVAAVFYVGGTSDGFSLGGEFLGVFRRENYASGGAFFPDPGRTRTMTRWALSAVGRFNTASGTFVKVGAGLGTITDIDTSVLDATPLKSFTSLVTTFGVGGRWKLGGVGVAPRADVLFHLGHGVRMTAVGGVALAIF